MKEIGLFNGCLITVLAEYTVFFFFGYTKKKNFGLLCVAVNVATNLSLNLILSVFRIHSPSLIVAAELVVLAVEYALYSLFLGRSKKLFAVTFLANCVTFTVGILLAVRSGLL